jgi:hypothetical protein
MDELPYLFNGLMGGPEYMDETQQESIEMSRNFVKLWTSFAENL